MKKLLLLLIFALTLLQNVATAQINIALTGVATHGTGGVTTFGPQNYNDQIIPVFPSQPWGWINTGQWIEYNWTTPQIINRVVFHKDNRPYTTMDIQYWDGSSYVNVVAGHIGTGANAADSITFLTPIVSTKLRFNNIQGSNPNFREIQVIQTATGFNNAGVGSITSPPFFISGNQPVKAFIKNEGRNQILVTTVNWEVNGVAQAPISSTVTLDTIGGTGIRETEVTLGTFNFLTNILYRVKVWTSMPNNVADTVNGNDTLVRLYRSPLDGNYTIGASGDFLTIRDAVNILTTSGVSGPVTFELIDNLYSTQTGETFPLTIGSYPGMAANNPILFKPSATSTPLIIDSNANHIFILDGAKYVTFDGRQSPTDINKNITIENKSRSANAGVVRYVNDAISCTMRNCIIRGSNNTTNATTQPVIGLVSIGGTSKTVPFGNDSITIYNNTFAQSNGLVYSHALVVDGQNITAQNDVINIDSNWFQGFGFNGVLVTNSASNFGNGSYFNIRGNSFYDTAQTVGTSATTAITAINFIPASNSGSNFNVIDGNFIGGKGPFAGGLVQTTGQPKWEFSVSRTTGTFTGIATSVGTLSGVSITRNVIRNIWLYSTGSYAVTGIVHTVGNATIGGSPGMGNQIGMQGDTSILAYTTGAINGIRKSTSLDHNISHNTVAGLVNFNTTTTTATLAGILSSGSGGTVNITNNIVRGLRTWSNSTGTGVAAALVGIGASSSSNSQTISNNIVGGTGALDSLMILRVGSARIIGIGASAGTNTITNNTVSGLVNFGNTLGTTTSSNIIGIWQGSGSNGHSVTNNTVSGLWLPTQATTTMIGILSSSGAASITNNNVNNLYAKSTYTGTTSIAAINGICAPTSSLHTISNNTISNFENNHSIVATSQINGIVFTGFTASTINNNTISYLKNKGTNTTSAVTGIYNGSSALNQTIEGNTIHSLASLDTAGTPVLNGIYCQASTTIAGNNTSVSRNFIHSFNLPTFTTQGAATINGINVASGSGVFANNIIRLGVDTSGIPLNRSANVRGIIYASGGVVSGRFYHNNIFINTNPNSGTTTSAAFDFTNIISTGGVLDIKNNIFANTSVNTAPATGNHFGLRLLINQNITSDFNIFHIGTAPTSFVSSIGFNSVDLNTHKTNTLMDGSSAQVDPLYINPMGNSSNLNLDLANTNPAEGMGDVNVATFVPLDFAGNTRLGRTPVDIGAYSSAIATNLADSFAPAITFNALLNTSSPLDRSFTATLFDASGVATGGNEPRVYFKKSTSLTWSSNAGVLQSGTVTNGVWQFTILSGAMGGLTTNDVVQYFVAAQDANANLNSNQLRAVGTVNAITTFPAAPRSYFITDPFPTTVLVGTGQTYTSLTGAAPTGLFNAINNGVIQGNTTVLITSDITETGTNQLNPWIESGAGGYSITIRPQNNTQRILTTTAANTNGLIRLSGVSRINILGHSPTGVVGDTNLIIRSSSTSTPALGFLNGGGLDTLIGVIFESRTTSNAIVWISTTAAPVTTGVNNVLFNRCVFRADITSLTTRPNIAFTATGTSPRFNSNISITDCDFVNFNGTGINVGSGNGNNWTITNNHFYFNAATSQTTTATAINFSPGGTSDNNTISNNWIGGANRFTTGPTWLNTVGFTGITVNSGLANGTTVNNNVITNVFMSGTVLTGITVSGNSANYVVNNNRIGNIDSTSSFNASGNFRILGINSTTTGNITILGDTILNINSNSILTAAGITGINVSSGSSNITNISNNVVNGLRVTSTNTGVTTAAALQGITLSSSSSAQTVANNTVRTLVNNAGAAHAMVGILCSSGINSINNNSIYGLLSRTTSTTTATTSVPICGLMVSTTLGGNQLVNGNIIDSISYAPLLTPVAVQMIGIYHAGSSLSVANYTNNTVRNLHSATSGVGITTSAAIIGLFINNSGSNQIVESNTVHTLQHWNNTATVVTGIFYTGTTSLTGNDSRVSRNFVHSFRSSATTAVPVFTGIQHTGFTTVANNMIRLLIDSSGTAFTAPINIRGIFHNTTAQSNFYHNSIYIGGAPTTGAVSTSALELASTVTTAQQTNIRNNILVNAVANTGSFGKNWGLKLVDTLRVVSNYNLFFTPNAGAFPVGRNTFDYATLTNWRSWSTQDLNSGYGDPLFNTNVTGTANVVSMDLQSNTPAERSGDPAIATLVTTDFFGNNRATNTPTDIGAHGGTFNLSADIFAPAISYTPLGNSGSLSGIRELNGVVITDNNGIPMTGPNRPKIYYTKDSVWYSSSATSVTGTATNAIANFSIDYAPLIPLTTNDTIKYFVIAMDNAGNTISNPTFAVATHVDTITTYPIVPLRYNFLPVLPANAVYQVGAGQTYPTLTGPGGLFEFLNSRTLGGNITAEINSDITEPGTVFLNPIAEDGAGAGTYTVTIRPNAATTSVRTIDGNAATGLIVLNGADRIKISGVPTNGNANSKLLLFRNNNTSGSVINLRNGVTGARLHNLLIEGNGSATTSATVLLSVNAGNIGNTFDTISNCVFRNNTTFTLPNGIPHTHLFSDGFFTTNAFNSNIVVSGNEFANFSTNGVMPNTYNTTGWQIINNSFYRNVNLSVSTITPFCIYLNAGQYMSGAIVKDNFIGGSAANCGGTPWTNANASASFYGIYGGFGNGPTSLIQGNTIANINYTATGGTGQFLAIYIFNGSATIGGSSTTGNIIGSTTTTNSINWAPNSTHYGIYYTATGTANITHNTVAGLNLCSPGGSGTFYGIYAGNGNIGAVNNNTIGSTTVANSITLNSNGTLFGIFGQLPSNLTTTYSLSNNVVSNMHAASNLSNTFIRGINVSNTSNANITDNTVTNLTSNSSSTVTTTSSAIGILSQLSANAVAVIRNNTVSGIRAVNTSAPTTSIGICISGGQSPIVERNRVFDITNASTSASTNPAPAASGICLASASVSTTLQNNQITLGVAQTANTQFSGIWLQVSSTAIVLNAYNNSVLITGTATGTQQSFAFLKGNNTGSEISTYTNLRNNIFANNRTGGSGKHYTIANQTSSPTNSTWNNISSNHNLFVDADLNTMGQWGLTDMTYSNWIANATSDELSYVMQAGTGAGQLNLGNLFTSTTSGNLNTIASNVEAWYVFGKGIAGSTVGGLANDFAGNARGTTAGFGITLGSTQINTPPTATPPAALASAAPAANTTTNYTFAGRNVLSINWGASAPTTASVLNFTGFNPIGTVPPGNNLNQYIRVDVSGGAAPYNYGVALNYDPALLGTVSSGNNLKISKENGGTLAAPTWSTQISNTVNQTNRIVSSSGLTSTSGFTALLFTGTENAAPPTIAGFTPNAREIGGAVTIRGSLFTGATAVSFNGTNQPVFTVVNDTTITTTVPAGTTTGTVAVTNPFGTGTSTAVFTIIPVPTVTSFNPATGTLGSTVTITGTGFTWATAVQFGGASATTFTINSNTSITATVPATAISGVVSVINPSGTGASSSVYTVIPAPTVSSFNPTTGPVGTSVVITGNDFQSITNVQFNGVNASYSVNSSTQITAIVPSGAATGLVAVINGSGTANSASSFVVTTPPVVNSFNPSSGGVGSSVVITGTNFTGATLVTFNGSPATTYTVNSSTQITAVVPASGSTGVISVTTPQGTASSSNSFTVFGDLIVTSGQAVSGTYNNIIVTNTGFASLTGNLTALGNTTVQGGGIIDFATFTLSGNGAFTSQGGALIRVGSPAGLSATGGVSGNVQVAGTRTYGGTIEYNGLTAQNTGNGLVGVDTVTISNVLGVTLNAEASINTRLNLGIGYLFLGNFNLTVNGSITNAASFSYIAQNESTLTGGVLRMPVPANNTPVTFPIGSATFLGSYTPVTITQPSGTADVFSAKVFRGAFLNGTSGTIQSSNVVNRSWVISEAVAGGSNATVQLQWDDSMELAGFNRFSNIVLNYANGIWNTSTAGYASASGLNPFTRSRAGVSTFGVFVVADIVTTLPVQLVSFKANRLNNDAVLVWETAQEKNNSHFVIERSEDGNVFAEIGQLAGKGNSNLLNRYTYTDKNLFSTLRADVVYYRLKQVDLSGKYTYHPVVSLAKTEADVTLAVKAYPNPFNGEVAFDVLTAEGGDLHIAVVDMQGRLVSKQISAVAAGQSTIKLEEADELAAGAYFVEVTLNNYTLRQKLVKSNQ